MELLIKPHHRNSYRMGGFIIRGSSIVKWFEELQRISIAVNTVVIYPLPGNIPNSISGCLVLHDDVNSIPDLADHERVQAINANLYIPENAILSPQLDGDELQGLFPSGIHLFHPSIGWAELFESLDPGKLLSSPGIQSYFVLTPEDGVHIPGQVRSFRVVAISPEDKLKEMDERIFPKSTRNNDKPLNPFERIKLGLYKLLLRKGEKAAADVELAQEQSGSPASWWRRAFSFLNPVTTAMSGISKRMHTDFEGLKDRNQSELDKLLKMLADDPAEALKYAIPLDGAGRGSVSGNFTLSKRWFNFPLSGGSSSSGVVDLGSGTDTLRSRYQQLALDFIEQKEYEKAAFIYMKLLKNSFAAAGALEKGGLFSEAAAVYLKHCQNKAKAAECYENGNMFVEAIELYEELHQHEKVGDLYIKLNKRKNAHEHYEKVISAYREKHQYVKASLIYMKKMYMPSAAQEMLMTGWHENRDGQNCLGCYFQNIDDEKQLENEFRMVQRTAVNAKNCGAFLEVLRNQKKRSDGLSDLNQIAYEVISTYAVSNPSIVHELKRFIPHDTRLPRDTSGYLLRSKSRK